MVSLDMRTVIFSFVLINIVSTLIIIFLWQRYSKRYKGIGHLVFAFLFQLIAYILIILRSSIPLWLSLDLANALSITGIFIGYLGMQEYTGRKTSQIPNYILLVLFGILHFLFSYLRPDPTARYLIISAAYLVFFGQCAWLMLFGAPKSIVSLTRYTGIIFIAFGILSGIKIVDFFLDSDKPVDYFNSGTLEAIIMVSYQMLIILLTLSFATMLNNHLFRDVKTEEEKFSTTFQTAPNAIVLSSFPGGRILEVNAGFTELTGYEPSEVIGKTATELHFWKTPDQLEECIREMNATGIIRKKEYQFRKKSGEFLTGLISAKVVELTNEKRVISSIFDITERKKLQDLVKHERNLLRTLVDNIPDPVSIKDNEGRYLLNNHAHLQVIGAETQEEAIGKTTFDFFPEEDANGYDEDDKSVMMTGKTIIDKIEFARHAETGFPYWHLTSKIPIRDDSGKSVQILTISHDITERKRSEDALRESDEFNRSLLKTIPFGMDVVDETGTILFMGENFRRMFGNDATGKKCWELYRDDSTQCPGCPLLKGIKNGTTDICEVEGILGGKIFDINHTGMMYHGKKAMLEIFHDITERKKNEGNLIRSKEKAEESDRLKTAFLHNISHEIRTPMNAIVGFSNLLREPDLTRDERDTYTELISRSSNHLLSIVNDVIEISNVEAGRLKLSVSEICLNSLLDDLLLQYQPKAAATGIQFRLELPGSDAIVNINTDGTKLIQVLSNLLNNSFKFTESGSIVFGYTIKNPFVEFFVSDTGIGIEPEQQIRIFERFYQVDSTITRLHEGTGIGLSISKAYVELLGGKMWLHSSPGKGSVFYFTIPHLKFT